MQEQNWWTVFLFPPWWCALLHSQDTGWMKWANFAPKNILTLCTIQDLLLKEQGNLYLRLESSIAPRTLQFIVLLLFVGMVELEIDL